ncbi:MAG: hypothetical protein Q9202_004278 [Teloschistes flavicans]
MIAHVASAVVMTIYYMVFGASGGPRVETRSAGSSTTLMQEAQHVVAPALETAIAELSTVPVPGTDAFSWSPLSHPVLGWISVLVILFLLIDDVRTHGPGDIRHLFGIMTEDQLSGPAEEPEAPSPAPDNSSKHGQENGTPDLEGPPDHEATQSEASSSSTIQREALRLRWARFQNRLLRIDRHRCLIRGLQSAALAAQSKSQDLKAQLDATVSTINDQVNELRDVKKQLADALDRTTKLEAEVDEANGHAAEAEDWVAEVQGQLDDKEKECGELRTNLQGQVDAANGRTADKQRQLDNEMAKSAKFETDMHTARRAAHRFSGLVGKTSGRGQTFHDGFAAGVRSEEPDLKELTGLSI